MDRFERKERLENENGLLVRIITAYKNEWEFDVAKIYEDGSQLTRNIDYFPIAGWTCAFPGKVYKYYNGKRAAEVDDWQRSCYDASRLCLQFPSAEDKKVLLKKYPEFKWVMKKSLLTNYGIFKTLDVWKNNKQLCETLFSMKCFSIAMNKSFYKMKNKMDILRWLSRNNEVRSLDPILADITLCVKYNITYAEMSKYRSAVSRYNYVSYLEWLYLQNHKNVSAGEYNDYRRMCIKSGHDFKDPYWHFPSKFKKQHDKVMAECQAIDKAREAERLAEAKRMKEERERLDMIKFNKFCKKMQKYSEMIYESEDVKVFVPDTVKCVDKHAKALHQCLISADYIKRVVDNKCLLVFVSIKDKPMATAELIRKGRKYKIGQFYGDEHKKDYNAPEKAKAALSEWLRINNFKMEAA